MIYQNARSAIRENRKQLPFARELCSFDAEFPHTQNERDVSKVFGYESCHKHDSELLYEALRNEEGAAFQQITKCSSVEIKKKQLHIRNLRNGEIL